MSEQEGRGIAAHVLREEDYWSLRKPFDQYLRDSVPAEEVQRDLITIQKRFRAAMSEVGQEGEDWELPGHYQHVRVFYAYLYSRKLYTPRFTEIVRKAMKGFEEKWIGEFECYDVPGCEDRSMTDIVYQSHRFIFSEADTIDELIPALGLTRSNAAAGE